MFPSEPTLTEGTKAMYAHDPDGVHALMDSALYRNAWETSFLARLRRGERDAVRLYTEIKRWVGAQPQFNIQVLNMLAVNSVPEAQELITRARRTADLSEDEIAASAVEWLRTRGWTCLEAGKGVHENGNGVGAAVR